MPELTLGCSAIRNTVKIAPGHNRSVAKDCGKCDRVLRPTPRAACSSATRELAHCADTRSHCLQAAWQRQTFQALVDGLLGRTTSSMLSPKFGPRSKFEGW